MRCGAAVCETPGVPNGTERLPVSQSGKEPVERPGLQRSAHRHRHKPHRFTLYEDDGETVAYLRGAVRRTRIVQRWRGDRLEITIGASAGSYEGAPAARETVLEVATCGAEAASVVLDGRALERRPSDAAFDAGGPGWHAGDGGVRVRTGTLPVAHAKRFVIVFASMH